jgi:hypothetical protein
VLASTFGVRLEEYIARGDKTRPLNESQQIPSSNEVNLYFRVFMKHWCQVVHVYKHASATKATGLEIARIALYSSQIKERLDYDVYVSCELCFRGACTQVSYECISNKQHAELCIIWCPRYYCPGLLSWQDSYSSIVLSPLTMYVRLLLYCRRVLAKRARTLHQYYGCCYWPYTGMG